MGSPNQAAVWRRGAKGPDFWHCGMFSLDRGMARKSTAYWPAQGSSMFWRYQKHVDGLRIAKPLDKDLPFFA